jgi:hypothetical protein
MTRIALTETPQNATGFTYCGKTYYICDPTYIGADIGVCIPEYVGVSPDVDEWY